MQPLAAHLNIHGIHVRPEPQDAARSTTPATATPHPKTPHATHNKYNKIAAWDERDKVFIPGKHSPLGTLALPLLCQQEAGITESFG